MLEQGSIDKPLNFNVALTQLSFHANVCYLIHSKVFSIQMYQHFNSVKLCLGFAHFTAFPLFSNYYNCVIKNVVILLVYILTFVALM